ncbi:MAG TPA: hypothetical protein DDW85_03075 [Porphyromonadaceae bacterium]|nr:hypothetical protein [Porphyromonadaceae bacterium]
MPLLLISSLKVYKIILRYNMQQINRKTLTFFTMVVSAQENYEQKLIDLLTTGRFFEAKEFYEQAEKDSVFDPFFRLYYKYEIARMLNRTDSAAFFLEQLLERGDEYFGAFKYQFYDLLLELYTFNLQDYKKAMLTCERIQKSLENNHFGKELEDIANDPQYVENRKKQIRKREKYPTVKFSRKDSNNPLKFKDDNKFLFFDAVYNNKTLH